MKKLKDFRNPFEGQDEINRTTLKIPNKFCTDLFKVHGITGGMQTTINILLVKLYDELKRNGITDYDPDRYKQCVSGAMLVFPGCAGYNELLRIRGIPSPDDPAGPDAARAIQAVVGNDGSGTVGVEREATRPSQLSDFGESPANDGRGSKAKGRRKVKG